MNQIDISLDIYRRAVIWRRRHVDGEIRVRGDAMHLARRVRDYLVAQARSELARRARRLAAWTA
jgi:hypothetical protein